MAHEERQKTKAGGEEKGQDDFASVSDALRFLPDGFKLPFALHAISQSNKIKNGVQEERRKGVSHVK